MDKKYKIFLITSLLIYIVYHLATLIYSPIPWFDEVSFAALSESYAKDHTFYETNRILVLPDQKYVYGPLYFMVQAFVIKTLGFSMFHIRLNSLLFGLIDLFLVYKICKHLKFKQAAAIFTVIIIALEPNFNQFLHSGRMDFMTLFFFLISYLVFVRAEPGNRKNMVLFSLLSGVCLAGAVLTTPRILFGFAFYIFAFIYEFFEGKNKGRQFSYVVLKYACLFVGFFSIYYIWIYWAFGSIGEYIYSNTHNELVQTHVGVGSKFRLSYYIVIYIYAFAAFLILLKNKVATKYSGLILISIPVIISFLFIVTGGLSGRYFALADPFLFVLIVGVSMHIYDNKILKGATYAVAGFFLLIFTAKALFIFSSLQQRDPNYNDKLISKYIKENSSVVADFQYYYIVRNKHCSFLSLGENGDNWDKKMQIFFDQKHEYFIVSKYSGAKEYYDKKLLSNNYELVADVEIQDSESFFHKLISKLPYKISESYSCSIYKRKGL
jgi:4-amino-4-deoxy-L-arabinose transferase-like glycosyltransferase